MFALTQRDLPRIPPEHTLRRDTLESEAVIELGIVLLVFVSIATYLAQAFGVFQKR